jgi:hypothetical protein
MALATMAVQVESYQQEHGLTFLGGRICNETTGTGDV